MTLAKYVAVLGSYIHNCIFVFKLKKFFFSNFLCLPQFGCFMECASCFSNPLQVLGCVTGLQEWWYGVTQLFCGCETVVLCGIYSINKRPTIEYTRRGQGCLHRGSVVFFIFFFWLRYYFSSSWCPVDARQICIMWSRRHLLPSHEDSGFFSIKLPRPSQPLQTFRSREARSSPLLTLPWSSLSLSKGGFQSVVHSGSVFSLGGGTAACHSFTLAPSLPLVPFFLPAFSSFYVSLCQTLCQVRRIKGSIKPRRGLTGGLGNPPGQPLDMDLRCWF